MQGRGGDSGQVKEREWEIKSRMGRKEHDKEDEWEGKKIERKDEILKMMKHEIDEEKE